MSRVKLYNPRGRLIEVEEKEVDVQQLLKKGFKLTNDLVPQEYNPQEDVGVVESPLSQPQKLGNVLETEEI
jgi:hypothetical protein